MAVTFQAVGTAVSATTGTLTVAWPAHVANDIALLWVTSSGGGTTETLATANGFTLINTQVTGTGTAGTKLSVYWARATSSAMAAPVVTAGTDFKYGVITTYRGAMTGVSPINAFAGAVKATASTAATMPAVTTTVASALVVLGISSDVDAATAFLTSTTNANLAGLTERFDAGTVSGLGGGIAVADGTQATAATTGTTAAVVVSSINAMITVALTPALVATGTINSDAELSEISADVVAFKAAGLDVATDTAALTVDWPAHTRADDVGLLWVTSSAGGTTETLTTAAGFTLIGTQLTGTGTAGTKLSVYWARAASSRPASPVVTAGTDFKYGVITTYRGVRPTGNPYTANNSGVKGVASTTASLPTVTTTVSNQLIVYGISSDVDLAAPWVTSVTNANLTAITERFDNGTATGLGGGIAVYTGVKSTVGATAASTATVASSINAFHSIALVQPFAEVTLTVTNAITGAVLSGATVLAQTDPAASIADSGATDVAGVAKVQLLPGSYKIRASLAGYLTNYLHNGATTFAGGDSIAVGTTDFADSFALMPGGERTGTVNASGTLSGDAETVTVLTATGTANASGTLSGVATTVVARTGTVGASSTLTAAATTVYAPTGTINAGSTLTGAATTVVTRTGTIQATGTLTATAFKVLLATGAVNSTGTLTAAQTATLTTTATLNATATLSATAVAVFVGERTGTAEATASLTATASIVATLAGTIPATATLTGAATSVRASTGTTQATSSLTGTAYVQLTATSTVNATSSLTAAATTIGLTAGTTGATSQLTGTTTLVAVTTGTAEVTATLTATTQAIATLTGTISALATLTGNATFELLVRNITATGILLARRWDAELTNRNKTGALIERDNTGTLLERTNTGTLTPRRWEGHTTK